MRSNWIQLNEWNPSTYVRGGGRLTIYGGPGRLDISPYAILTAMDSDHRRLDDINGAFRYMVENAIQFTNTIQSLRP